jgi:hypothetical protein
VGESAPAVLAVAVSVNDGLLDGGENHLTPTPAAVYSFVLLWLVPDRCIECVLAKRALLSGLNCSILARFEQR